MKHQKSIFLIFLAAFLWRKNKKYRAEGERHISFVLTAGQTD